MPLTDDDLRRALRAAHAGDAPPRFPLRRSARRARLAPALALTASAAVAAIAGWRLLERAAPAPVPPVELAVAELSIDVRYPLDFLLDVPGVELLRTTPRFPDKETWP